MVVTGRGFCARALWQAVNQKLFCIDADSDIEWMRGKVVAEIIPRCIKDRLTMQWIDSDG